MLEIVEPGWQTTVQDLGRHEWGHIGVPGGGAADTWSLRVANALLGNDLGAAGLEVTAGGFRARATASLVVGLAGADLGATDASGRLLDPGRTVALRRGDELVLPGPAEPGHGARAYVSLPGGVDVPVVLGSRSTCLAAAFGGHDGRALRAGDRLGAVAPESVHLDLTRRWPATPRPPHVRNRDGSVIARVVPVPAYAAGVPQSAVARLLGAVWVVSPDSDRMGLRLDPADGVALDAPPVPLVSHGVATGAVQLPPDGRPIVLLADHQPTGGYPVPVVTISADVDGLGQLAPGDRVRFELVDPASARDDAIANRAAFANALRLLAADDGWDELWRSAGG